MYDAMNFFMLLSVNFEILELGDWEIAISKFPNCTFPN